MQINNKHIVLVDDDVDDCVLFEDALRDVDAQLSVTKAFNGKELMDILHKQRDAGLPYIVYLDINMPVKNGFECLSEIRADDKLKNLHIIVLSTSCDKEFINRTYRLGADYYICKPNNFSDLQSVIAKSLTINWHDGGRPAPEDYLLGF